MNPTDKDAFDGVGSGDSKQREVASGGLPLAFRATLRRLRSLLERPEYRVFSAPVSKGLVLALGLACVAMLGKESDERERRLASSSGAPSPSNDGVPVSSASAPLPSASVAPVAPAAPPAAAPAVAVPCAASTVVESAAIVDLNVATEKELRTLPGVGAKKAAAILALRERLGRFKKVTDLLRVKGIGPKTLAKWRSRLVVGEPPLPQAAKTGE